MIVLILFAAILFCLFLVIVEYIWLFILSKRREKQSQFKKTTTAKFNDMFNACLLSLTDSSLDDEIISIKKYVNSPERMNIVTDILYKILVEDDDSGDSNRKKIICARIINVLDPNKHYLKLLKNSNNYNKAYSCKKLSIFNASESIPEIRKYVNTSNFDLKYHSILALSILGDHDGLVKLFTDYSNKYFFSYRVIIEILDCYFGDRLALVKEILENCSDYIKGTLIKAVAKYKYNELDDIFVSSLRSKNSNVKISAIRAIGELANSKNEHELIIMCNDKNWSVRAAAVKALDNFRSQKSIDTIIKATSDPEWWVRNNAAKSLLSLDDNLVYAKNIISGYDRFAADAVKFAIFQKFKVSS